jgi:hypothetical protein
MTSGGPNLTNASRSAASADNPRRTEPSTARERLGPHAWITLGGERGAFCLVCADLDHLVFLASGDPALTRRARKRCARAAVVLQWSRARKRYERQGLLVDEEALQRAEEECLADAEIRIRCRQRGRSPSQRARPWLYRGVRPPHRRAIPELSM